MPSQIEYIKVDDPCDRCNPATELVSRTGHVMYHGTHSSHCASIEQHGFRTDIASVERNAEIDAIVTSCKKINVLPDGYAVAKGLGHGQKSYFTLSYSTARDYAAALGGERADGAMRAARGFLEFVAKPERIKVKAALMRNALTVHGPDLKTECCLRNLEDFSFVRELEHIVRTALLVLEDRYLAGCPVVYLLRNTSDDGGDPDHDMNTQVERFGGLQSEELRADQIIARIEFVNGIDPNTLHYVEDAVESPL